MTKYRILLELAKLYTTSKNLKKSDYNKYTVGRFFENVRQMGNKPDESLQKSRDLTAKILKQIKIWYPYKPKDYSEAKDLYDAYFEMDNHIPSFEHIRDEVEADKEIYVVKFRSDAPVKGDKFNDYYISSSSTMGQPIYKLTKVSTSRTWIDMDDPVGYADVSCIADDMFTNYRYATKKEIALFKSSKKKIVKVQKFIDLHRKEMEELRNDLYKIQQTTK